MRLLRPACGKPLSLLGMQQRTSAGKARPDERMTPEERASYIVHRYMTPILMPSEFKAVEKWIADAIRQAIQEEREACANVCDERERSWKERGNGYANGCADCAQEIRERK